MPNLQPVTSERHAKRYWKRYSSYSFAADDALVPLMGVELPKAVMAMPIAFVERSGQLVPAAVLGLEQGKNLFVAQNGVWAGSYIPAAFRAYPFRLLNAQGEQLVMHIDEDSGLVVSEPAGERFFDDDGQPSRAVKEILNFMTQLEQSRLATLSACAALQKHNLTCPWAITLKTDAGEKRVAGLLQIDEAAMNALSAEAFLELRRAGALPLAYCQLLSKQHLPMLGKLAEAHAEVAAQALAVQSLALGGELNLEFFNNNGTISFAGLI